MTLAIAVASAGVRVPLARERVRVLAHTVLRAEGVREGLISIAFVTSRAIARLNRVHLGHVGPTDVLAFALQPPGRGAALVGDVYIAPDVARRNARRWHVGVREELARLVVHGLLHMVGHDHPLDEDRETSPMWRRQERLLRRCLRVRP
jgi:probable rRNA maturation factor